MKNKKRLYWILGIVVVILMIIAVFSGGKKEGINIKTEKAQLRNITETVSASGKIEPEIEVKISPEVSGEIIELLVNEGEAVKSGQLLVRINPDLYQSAVDRARAAVLSAKANYSNGKARQSQAEAQFTVSEKSYNRSKNLHLQGAISDAEFEQAESSFQVARAEVDAARESVKGAQFGVESAEASFKEANDNLRRTTIYAPKDGIVTGLVVEEGERVVGTGMMGGTELMRISDLSAMEVNVEVNESDIVKVNMGDTAIIEVDAYLNDKFKGIVTEIGNMALNSMGTASLSMDQVTNFSVKIRILPESYQKFMTSGDTTISPFRPGMSATVDIMTASAFKTLSIPIKAVTTREDTTSSGISKYIKKEEDEVAAETDETKDPVICVFVNTEGKARLKVVETGVQDNKYIQIISGINEGDEVITGPYEAVSRSLKNGSKVKISTSKKEEEESEKE